MSKNILIHFLRPNMLTLYSLGPKERDLLKKAGSKVSTHAGIASLVGLGLGVYGAYRLRNMRVAYFKAFRAMEKPVEVRFADGRTGKCISMYMLEVLTWLPRTRPRYLCSDKRALAVGRCCNLLLLLRRWSFPRWRNWFADWNCVGNADCYKRPREQGKDREGLQELQN